MRLCGTITVPGPTLQLKWHNGFPVTVRGTSMVSLPSGWLITVELRDISDIVFL